MKVVNPIELIGGVGSPYTRKMVSYLRYRRIPYRIIWGDPAPILDEKKIKKPKPSLLPTFILPDENNDLKAVTDSTPIIRRLEKEFEDRHTIPNDPVLSFINYVLEDFADEWGTKFMFHYRWHDKVDADNAGTILPLQTLGALPDDMLMNFKTMISQRQIDRLWVVGSNNSTAPIIDASYRRILEILEKHFTKNPFLLGKRPSSADFALFGQFSQLVNFDPTPRSIAHQASLRTVAWVGLMEDQSGLMIKEDDWMSSNDAIEQLTDFFKELSRGYIPALIANYEATEKGDKEWEATIDNCLWKQKSFPYQSKCLKWINDEYALLDEAAKSKIDNFLESTGCKKMILV